MTCMLLLSFDYFSMQERYYINNVKAGIER
jgi:hypothetical protein